MEEQGLDRHRFDQRVLRVCVTPQGHRKQIRVADIRKAFERFGRTKQIKRHMPHIRSQDISLARAFLVAADPSFYQANMSKKQAGKFRCLVDECVSLSTVLPAIHSIIGPSTHAAVEGLEGLGDGTGRGDSELWKWAVNNNIDAIITLDVKDKNPAKDLCAIAAQEAKKMLLYMDRSGQDVVDMDELPVVVVLKCLSRKSRHGGLVDLITEKKNEILSYIETRTTPYIIVRPSGVRIEKTYTELYAQARLEAGLGNGVLSRRDQNIKNWYGKIVCDIPPGQRTARRLNEVERRVRAAAALCESLPPDPMWGRSGQSSGPSVYPAQICPPHHELST